MIEKFKVIDNYLMVKMPEEIDHHQSLYIRLIMWFLILKERNFWIVPGLG